MTTYTFQKELEMSNEASRKAFEAWARSFGCSFKTTGYAPYDYCNADVRLLWRSWQASRKALEAEQAQTVEPAAVVLNGHYQQRVELADGVIHNLYTHPAPPPAKQVQTGMLSNVSFESLIGTTQHRPALPAQQVQIDDLRTQLARRTVERDMAIQMAACGEQVQTVEPFAWVYEAAAPGGYFIEFSQVRRTGDYANPLLWEESPLYTNPVPPHAEPTVKQPLPTWDECELFCTNPKYTASALHQFIYAYDDADSTESALFMRRLELVLREQSQHTAQQVEANHGCQYPMCHSEGYQQAVTAKITAELWTGVVVPPGYALVPIKMTPEMLNATEQDDWQWADVLAAAEAITEDQYAASTQGCDAQQVAVPALRELLEGMTVSIDVSTGDHDAGNRLFGIVNEVMESSGDKHGLTLLVYETKPNFNAAQQAAVPAAALTALKEMIAMMDSGDEHGEGSEWYLKARAAIASSCVAQAAALQSPQEDKQ